MNRLHAQHLRLLLFCLYCLLVAGLLWLGLGAAHSALMLWRELRELPTWLTGLVGTGIGALLLGSVWLGWRLLRPARRKPTLPAQADRPAIERRIAALADAQADTVALQAELQELDRRQRSGECYVAVFGEISSGKSSLIRAMAPQADVAVDVLGGTTTVVSHHRGELGDGRALLLADVPGSHEVGGQQRERIARDEALRAHAVVYVAAGDLGREQDAELRWLRTYGKPLILALTKSDLWQADERRELIVALQQRYASILDALVLTHSSGQQRIERVLPDGRRESATRDRPADVQQLRNALVQLTAAGTGVLEPAREQAVLGHMQQRISQAEREVRQRQAQRLTERYTRRAVVGALAAVAPGTDLLIQGALATSLLRELAALYGISIKQLDLDAFLAQAKMGLRTSTSVVLAIAGNALKAFPGLGTLSGGAVHAVAYGLIFDSLGRAVAHTLDEQDHFDQAHAAAGLQRLLQDSASERLQRIAAIAAKALREPDSSA